MLFVCFVVYSSFALSRNSGEEDNLELKALELVKGVHEVELPIWMHLAGIQTGLLIDLNVQTLKDGTKQFKLRPLRFLKTDALPR